MSDPSKDWHIPRGKDPILYRYSPDDLRKFGYADFLDGETPSSPSDEFLTPDLDTGLVAPIHPILRAINFPSTPLDTYQAMHPALQLASALLCEPTLQPFLHAVYCRNRHTKISGLQTSAFRERRTLADPVAVYREVAHLAQSIEFRFEDLKKGGAAGDVRYAETTIDEDKAVSRSKYGYHPG